jgi:hypothetical protein
MEIELTVHTIEEAEMPYEQQRALDRVRQKLAEGQGVENKCTQKNS